MASSNWRQSRLAEAYRAKLLQPTPLSFFAHLLSTNAQGAVLACSGLSPCLRWEIDRRSTLRLNSERLQAL